MISYPHWDRLLDQLEADLRARESSDDRVFVDDIDDDAWETMEKILRKRARGLVTRLDLQVQDIEDVVQTVLLKLQSAKAMRQLRAARSPEGYVFVILRNAATDVARRRKREKLFYRSVKEEGEGVEPASAPEYVLQTEEASVVGEALKSLTQEERELLRMRFWRDMTIAEIAHSTGDSYSAVAVKLFRILHGLHDYLERS